MLVGSHDSGIEKDNVQINPLQAFKHQQDIPPYTALHPALPAHINGVPRPVLLLQNRATACRCA